MKTAISIPEKLFRKAEATARKMRVSRSRFYAMAIEEFIERRRTDRITERLNELYAKEPSGVESALHSAQISSLHSEVW